MRKWAEFRKTKAGIKVHMRLTFVEEDEVIPEKATVTVAKKNDRTLIHELVHETGVTTSLIAAISTMQHSIVIVGTAFSSLHA